MSSREPSTLNYSLFEFAKHGGLTYSNKSGWGISYYQDRDAFLIKEPEPAADSKWVQFIKEQRLRSHAVIAHVRLATVGEPKFRNTHPFKRELGGHAHVFAHNGTLGGLHDQLDPGRLVDRPMGETDSELAFCELLNRMRKAWCGTEKPSIDSRIEVFSEFCRDMTRFGSANFLYTDGELLFSHGHRRVYEEHGEFSDPRPPGMSIRNCSTCQEGEEHWTCNGLDLELTDPRTVMFASVPLGEVGWHPLSEGEVVTVANGEIVSRESTL